MTKYITIVILFICTSIAFGQEKEQLEITKNHVSIDPFLLTFGTLQFQYEYQIGKNMSVGGSLGYKFSSGIFKAQGIQSPTLNTENIDFTGVKIMPEFRWYLNNEQGIKGFYIGSYYRFFSYGTNISGSYVNNESSTNLIDLDVAINSHTIGFEAGYKIMLFKKKAFYLDFLIAGPGVSFNKVKFTENLEVADGFYSTLGQELSKYSILESLDIDDINIDKNKGFNITLPAFRYGIKIGYCF